MMIACPTCGTTNRVSSARLLEQPKCGNCKTALILQAPMPLADEAAFEELITGSPLPVLVDFWAPWCGPCRVVAPELEKLARERAGEIVIAKVNTDELPTVAGRFGIQSIPTLVLFRERREAQRVSGAMPATAIAQRFGL